MTRRFLAIGQALLYTGVFIAFFGAWVFAPVAIFAIALMCFLAGVILHVPARLERVRRRSRRHPESDDA